MFDKRVTVFEGKDILVGKFNPAAPGCYDNVLTFAYEVKTKRNLYFDVDSDIPISVAIANDDNSSAFHKEDVTVGSFGPISTADNKEMGLFLGVYPGDKAKVNIQIWMEKK